MCVHVCVSVYIYVEAPGSRSADPRVHELDDYVLMVVSRCW